MSGTQLLSIRLRATGNTEFASIAHVPAAVRQTNLKEAEMSIDVLGSLNRPEQWVGSRVLKTLARHVITINAGLQLHKRLRADRKILMEMPDYLLTDIGMRRPEIDTALRYGREIDRIRDEGRL
jgi:uncharacterized protein YjiS (DUF1127 family)